MASPQKENGYTPISNELLDAILKRNFISTHLKLILCCCRYTYGFSRKQAELSESYIHNATGIGKRYISQELKTLIDMNVIKVIKESSYTSSRIISLNKNYEEWGSRTTVLQSNHNSTDGLQYDTTVAPQTNTTVAPQCYQESKTKTRIKQEDNLYFIPEEIRQAVLDFMEFRKKIKSPMTDTAVKLLVSKLNMMSRSDDEKKLILEQSIMNGWKSVYELKDGSVNQRQTEMKLVGRNVYKQ